MLNKKLATKLLSMSKADQDMRKLAEKDMSLFNNTLDKKHTSELKKIIEQHGWPTITMVGAQASNAAWLIVQHSDRNQEFQEQCLELMQALPENEVAQGDIAYLEDRVRVAQGRPQLYGTQFDRPGKDFGPKEVEDKKNLDIRRKAVGLEPFETYRKSMVEFYQHIHL